MSSDAPASPAVAPVRPSARLVAVCTLFVLAVAAGGYAWTGVPAALGGQPPVDAAAQASEAQQVAEFTGMVEKLRTRMETEPSAEGLAMLGRSYLVLGKPDDAVAAYQRALKMQPQSASLLADMADAMGVKNGNSLTGAPMAFVEQSLRLDPKNLKALMLAGSEAFDRNDHANAIVFWQRMVDAGPADSPLVEQAGQAITEARRLQAGGAPMAAAAAPGPVAASAAAGTAAAQPAVAASASVTGTVSLAAALRAKAAPEDTVFIFARPAQGSRMPLAILRRQVKDLPADFVLDDSLAMSPAARLSGAGTVIVGARISKSGNAMPQPGDLEGLSAPIAVGTQGLRIEIDQTVR